MSLFTCVDPRGPLYVPVIRAKRFPVSVHYPVLTPDHGVIMCTTEADQFRVAAELNRLSDEVEALREALRISRQSEREAWRYAPELEAERSALQSEVNALIYGEQLAQSVEALLVAVHAEDAARAAWDECGCGTPEFDRWSVATRARCKCADQVRADMREFRRRSANAQIEARHGA